jgi:hypothetical protein
VVTPETIETPPAPPVSEPETPAETSSEPIM